MKKLLAAITVVAILAFVGTAGADGQGKGKGKGKGGFGGGPDIFKKMDANNDGKVSKDEFTKALEKFGQGKGGEFADRIFNKLDADKDGSLSKDEFKVMADRFKGKGKPGDKKKKDAEQ